MVMLIETMPISAEEIHRAFRESIKTLSCPHCATDYTDYACDWSEAWSEGRREAIRELGHDERDGPVKLKCELCGGKALTDVFSTPPKPV